jgi:hypothetical protein
MVGNMALKIVARHSDFPAGLVLLDSRGFSLPQQWKRCGNKYGVPARVPSVKLSPFDERRKTGRSPFLSAAFRTRAWQRHRLPHHLPGHLAERAHGSCLCRYRPLLSGHRQRDGRPAEAALNFSLDVKSKLARTDRLLNLGRSCNRITQLVRNGSPPPGLRLPPAKLSRKSN